MTDAPIITDGWDYNDDDRMEVTGNVWWFPAYEIIDPVEELAAKGRVVFTKA